MKYIAPIQKLMPINKWHWKNINHRWQTYLAKVQFARFSGCYAFVRLTNNLFECKLCVFRNKSMECNCL